MMTAVWALVRRDNSLAKNSVDPIVADMRRNRALGKVSSGTCQATPRSRSE